MGVTGLWQIVHPCARPIKLETLNRKRLAVDASIWIYQFLKAVRDKEGNALRNSHVVGFFRRICKLLFFGIKPVFVFDGEAPLLKKQTIGERKKRREGRKEDAVRTAGRLLAVQMQRRAEEEEIRRKEAQNRAIRATEENEDEVVTHDEGLVYADENLMDAQERARSRKFRKQDAYHLPELDVSLSEMGGPDDVRIMSMAELQAYANQFERGEELNFYDFSKIDYDSQQFVNLPAADRYNILNHARLRSRLRMGHSKEQLDSMFPDRMAFSKFQIDRVKERNELTQRLMHLNESGDALFGGGRVAGEKGKEYVLVRNEGAEGGYALGVISDEGMKEENAIDLDQPTPVIETEAVDREDEDEFEDVPIEGLNRLPKRPRPESHVEDNLAKRRRALYKSRRSAVSGRKRAAAHADSLFVCEDPVDDDEESEWEEVDASKDLFGEEAMDEEEDEELRRAVAMSLEQDDPEPSTYPAGSDAQEQDSEGDDMLEVFRQNAVAPAGPVPKGTGRAIANIVNKRAWAAAPESHEVTSFGVPAPKEDASDQEDLMDFQAALAESRKHRRRISPPTQQRAPSTRARGGLDTNAEQENLPSGPLPFQRLNLGSSLLGKKKMQKRSEDMAGGFENPEIEQAKPKKAEPLPPWFAGNVERDLQKQREEERNDWKNSRQFHDDMRERNQEEGRGLRHRANSGEAIDLDEVEQQRAGEDKNICADDSPKDGDDQEKLKTSTNFEPVDRGTANEQAGSQMPQSCGSQRAAEEIVQAGPSPPHKTVDERRDVTAQPTARPSRSSGEQAEPGSVDHPSNDGSDIAWSVSDCERNSTENQRPLPATPGSNRGSRSPSAEFEDVQIPAAGPSPQDSTTRAQSRPAEDLEEGVGPGQNYQASIAEEDDVEDFSDPEEEDLLRQLTMEAEEHARFASTWNHRSQAENIADYEKEFKQLRNQQKKDRRDADEVTHIMVQECQQLLKLFGLPYVTAPMEAEAQCAELVRLGLVDGIVTDDSDCFLFGGTRVYKNMFNQAKFVECYLSSDFEREFDLTRDKLIQIAHLLGSDYTEGLPGVGPVTALEILGEFDSLNDFKTWWEGVQRNSIPKSEDAHKLFRKKFRKNATKLFLPPAFPDARVGAAYEQPQVDSDTESFQWGVPDLDALRGFLTATIGWSPERTDEVLVPVIRDMNRRADEGTQANLTAFFTGGVGIGGAGKEGFAPRKRVKESSKRMGGALGRLAERARRERDEMAAEDKG